MSVTASSSFYLDKWEPEKTTEHCSMCEKEERKVPCVRIAIAFWCGSVCLLFCLPPFLQTHYWHELNQTVSTLSFRFYTDCSRSRQVQRNKNILWVSCGLKLSPGLITSRWFTPPRVNLNKQPRCMPVFILTIPTALLCNKTQGHPTKRSHATYEWLRDASLMTCTDCRTKTAAHVLFLRQIFLEEELKPSCKDVDSHIHRLIIGTKNPNK